MTVKELIDALQEFPPDLPVSVEGIGPYDDIALQRSGDGSEVLLGSQEQIDELGS